MISNHFCAELRKLVRGHAEFDELALWRNASLGECFALGFRRALGFRLACTHHDGVVAIITGDGDFFFLLAAIDADFTVSISAVTDDLAAIERQNGHRNVTALIVEDSGHTQLTGNNPGT